MLGMLDFSPRKGSQRNLRAANSVARRSMVPCIYLSGDIKLAFKSFFPVRGEVPWIKIDHTPFCSSSESVFLGRFCGWGLDTSKCINGASETQRLCLRLWPLTGQPEPYWLQDRLRNHGLETQVLMRFLRQGMRYHCWDDWNLSDKRQLVRDCVHQHCYFIKGAPGYFLSRYSTRIEECTIHNLLTRSTSPIVGSIKLNFTFSIESATEVIWDPKSFKTLFLTLVSLWTRKPTVLVFGFYPSNLAFFLLYSNGQPLALVWWVLGFQSFAKVFQPFCGLITVCDT